MGALRCGGRDRGKDIPGSPTAQCNGDWWCRRISKAQTVILVEVVAGSVQRGPGGLGRGARTCRGTVLVEDHGRREGSHHRAELCLNGVRVLKELPETRGRYGNAIGVQEVIEGGGRRLRGVSVGQLRRGSRHIGLTIVIKVHK